MWLNLSLLVDAVRVAATLLALGVLSIEDLRTRELSARIVHAYLAVTTALFIVSFITGSGSFTLLVVYAAFSLLVSAGLFTSLYKLGLVGDGDVYVAIALGLALFYPSIYRFTLPLEGMLPPSLVAIFYAALTSMFLMLVNAVRVLAKYRGVLSALSTKYKIILPFVSRPVKLREYLNGVLKHHFPVQEFTVSGTEVLVRYRLLARIDEDQASVLRKLVDQGVLSEETYIWVSPGIPFIFHLFLGVLLLLVLGDVPLVHLLMKLFSRP
ncbi:MAG: A24 family peptidase C-terminal domain-containing protein [Desulfurococcaceae archaeon]